MQTRIDFPPVSTPPRRALRERPSAPPAALTPAIRDQLARQIALMLRRQLPREARHAERQG